MFGEKNTQPVCNAKTLTVVGSENGASMETGGILGSVRDVLVVTLPPKLFNFYISGTTE